MTPMMTVTGAQVTRVFIKMSELDEAMLEHMANIIFSEKRPFSYKDFLNFEVNGKEFGMVHKTFRNKISKLKKSGEVEDSYHSHLKFYTLKGLKFTKPMTTHHMGVTSHNSFYNFIKDLPLQRNALHDIRLWFKLSGIWSILSTNSTFNINPKSKDIRLSGIKENDIYLGITVHRTDSVSVIAGCSYTPIAVDVNGIIRLSTALAIVRERLGQWIKASAMLVGSKVYQNLEIPPYNKWIVKMWHFGADASIEYAGEKFEVTYASTQEALIRVYSKKMKDRKIRIRLEGQEYPNTCLADAIENKLYLNSLR